MKQANKQRDMKGVRPGRGSAGRVNARPPGFREPKRDRFLDVFIASKNYLIATGNNVTNYEFYLQEEYR